MEYVIIESGNKSNYSFDKIVNSVYNDSFKKYKLLYHNRQSEVRLLPNGNVAKASNCKGFLIFYF